MYVNPYVSPKNKAYQFDLQIDRLIISDRGGVPLKTTEVTFDVTAWFNTVAYTNSTLDKWNDANLDPTIFDLGTPGLLPLSGSSLLSGANFTGLASYFETVSYKGAFGTSNWASWADWNCAITDYQ